MGGAAVSGVVKMTQHEHLLNQYKPAIGAELPYPVDSQFLNTVNDPWEFQPGYNKTEPTPTDKTLWAQSGKDVAKYKDEFVKKYGTFKLPFIESTMMVSPVEWRTGYSDETSQALTQLALMQGEAIKIKDAIGVINNSIQQLEGLLYGVQNDLVKKRRLRKNREYIDLALKEAPEIVTTLDSDIASLEALELAYGNQLGQLRVDARVLNQELSRTLNQYMDNAAKLNINDNFAAELKKATGSGTIRGAVFGSLGGVLATGALVFLIAQSRRADRRVRSTARGADGLFFRAPRP